MPCRGPSDLWHIKYYKRVAVKLQPSPTAKFREVNALSSRVRDPCKPQEQKTPQLSLGTHKRASRFKIHFLCLSSWPRQFHNSPCLFFSLEKSIPPSSPPSAAVCLFLTSGSISLFMWHFCVLTELACSQLMGRQSSFCYSVIVGGKSHKTDFSYLYLPLYYGWTSANDNVGNDTRVNNPTHDCFELINAK